MPETIQVVVVGDSLAYGTGDETGGGIAGRLENELRRRGIPSVRALNLGVSGAHTADVQARLRNPLVRDEIGTAHAIVLSVGANDLFRESHSREELLSAPNAVAERILVRMEQIVSEIRSINPRARILILGGYNPLPRHEWASTIEQYLVLWDQILTARFEQDDRIIVVKMADIVTPQRLSRHDDFHPGADAYDEAAKRIAEVLMREMNAA